MSHLRQLTSPSQGLPEDGAGSKRVFTAARLCGHALVLRSPLPRRVQLHGRSAWEVLVFPVTQEKQKRASGKAHTHTHQIPVLYPHFLSSWTSFFWQDHFGGKWTVLSFFGPFTQEVSILSGLCCSCGLVSPPRFQDGSFARLAAHLGYHPF